jgi:sialate O-acetylesterase
VAATAVDEPADSVRGSWIVCTPATVAGFSATAYSFGRDLHDAIKQPVGLINTSWGGTRIEPWISGSTLATEPLVKEAFERFKSTPIATDEQVKEFRAAEAKWTQDAAEAHKENKRAPAHPERPAKLPGEPQYGRLYDGMVAPLVPYAIRGAIWYQGESNGGEGIRYRSLLPDLITDWRTHWNQAGAAHDFPFLVVQLPNNGGPTKGAENAGWTLLREAQAKTAEKLPNVGTAVTIDTSADGNLHPSEKQPVGHRLALIAENKVYGKADVVSSGPVFDSLKADGDKLKITFKETHGGLEAKGDALVGFYVAGEDKKFVPADATIDGDSVILHSDEVKSPVAARYAWSQNPKCNLFNKADLPAGPFRTDDWDGLAADPRRPAK